MFKAIDEFLKQTLQLSQRLQRVKSQRIEREDLKTAVREYIDAYRNVHRPQLDAKLSPEVLDPIDSCVARLMKLTHSRSDRRHYFSLLTALRRHLSDAGVAAIGGADASASAATEELGVELLEAKPLRQAAGTHQPRQRRPRAFVGSSIEGLDIAYAIQEELEHSAEVTVWPQDVFKLTRSALESLLARVAADDFAVFVFTPDDAVQMRQHEYTVARDNVILEFGLFLGALGADRVFFIVPRGVDGMHLPTDLLGIEPATFDSHRTDGNLRAAVGPACNQIRKQLSRVGARASVRIAS